MIRAIIFDFDGVIVESADIKTQAFKELFSEYPQKINRVINYHLANTGVSRYVKFGYIYKQILRKRLPKNTELKLGRRLSQIVLKNVMRAPFVKGARKFLQKNKSRYQFFIASGTPEDELRNIISFKRLKGYFKKIYGSPKNKIQIINDIIKRYNFTRNEIVYVGDAQSDRIAAEETGIFFIERKASLNPKAESASWKVRDLTSLEKKLGKIEKLTFKECD